MGGGGYIADDIDDVPNSIVDGACVFADSQFNLSSTRNLTPLQLFPLLIQPEASSGTLTVTSCSPDASKDLLDVFRELKPGSMDPDRCFFLLPFSKTVSRQRVVHSIWSTVTSCGSAAVTVIALRHYYYHHRRSSSWCCPRLLHHHRRHTPPTAVQVFSSSLFSFMMGLSAVPRSAHASKMRVSVAMMSEQNVEF